MEQSDTRQTPTYTFLTNPDGYSREEEEYFAKLKPKRYHGDLDEDHIFYFSDIIDIMSKERDINRKIFRLKVLLHGSKEKKERPLFQHNDEILVSWTSGLGGSNRMYQGVQSFGTGLEPTLQKLVELGFVNHLLILMTHGYRYVYHKKKPQTPPKDDVSVDHFLYEPKCFQESDLYYPYHATEILLLIIKHSDWNTFLAIMERYFSSKHNGPRSSKLINDGRHTIMNGVGVFYKTLKYGLSGMKETLLVILKTIHTRCKTFQKNILYNTKFPLIEALFDSLNTLTPEKVIQEFSTYPGESQLRYYSPKFNPNTEHGKLTIEFWVETLRNSNVDVAGLFINEAKRNGNRKLYLDPKYAFPWTEEEIKFKPDRENYNKLLFRLSELIDSKPLNDYCINEYHFWLSCIFSNLLFEKEVCDKSNELEQIIDIDYPLLDFISGEDYMMKKLCNSLKRLYHDPMYKLANFTQAQRKFLIAYHGSDAGSSLSEPKFRHTVETMELGLLDLFSLLSYNSLIAYKLVQYDNQTLLEDFLKQETNITEFLNMDQYAKPALAFHSVFDEEDGYFSIGRNTSILSILYNMFIAAPEHATKLPNVHDLLLKAVVENKDMINFCFVSGIKNYKLAAHAYKGLFRIFNDLLEESAGKTQVDQQRAILSSNIGEMCLRLEKHELAGKYLKYSLKYDPHNEKTKRRLDRVKQ